MKFSIANFIFEAKTINEATDKAFELMYENNIKTGKLIAHLKNEDIVVSNIYI
jgi:hypothetical protein